MFRKVQPRERRTFSVSRRWKTRRGGVTPPLRVPFGAGYFAEMVVDEPAPDPPGPPPESPNVNTTVIVVSTDTGWPFSNVGA